MILLGFYKSHALRINVRYRVIGLEINPDHRAQFEIDEQQQNVIDLDVAFLEHPEKLHHRRVCRHRTDGKQRQIVEGFDEQVAQGLGQLMHVLPQFLGPVYFHDDVP